MHHVYLKPGFFTYGPPNTTKHRSNLLGLDGIVPENPSNRWGNLHSATLSGPSSGSVSALFQRAWLASAARWMRHAP